MENQKIAIVVAQNNFNQGVLINDCLRRISNYKNNIELLKIININKNYDNRRVEILLEINKIQHLFFDHRVILLIDLSLISIINFPDKILLALKKKYPKLIVICTNSDYINVSQSEIKYVLDNGATGLFGCCSTIMPRHSLFPMIRSIFKDTTIDIEEIIRLIEPEITPNNGEIFSQIFETMKKLKDLNLSIEYAYHLLNPSNGKNGLRIKDRNYILKNYPKCFIGGEALLDAMEIFKKTLSKDKDSENKKTVNTISSSIVNKNANNNSNSLTLNVLNALYTLEYFDHVTSDNKFKVDNFYYRFYENNEKVNNINLNQLATDLRSSSGVTVKDRVYMSKQYDDCFIGTEAVSFVTKKYDLTRPEAVAVLQRLLRLKFFTHVLGEHRLADFDYFYTFKAFVKMEV